MCACTCLCSVLRHDMLLSCRLTFIIGACAEAGAMLLATVLYFRTRSLYGRKQQEAMISSDQTESS